MRATAASTGPAKDLSKVYDLASETFCNGAWRGLQSLTLARRHGVAAVTKAIRREAKHSESTGSWGRWDRVLNDLKPASNRPVKVPHKRSRGS